MSLYFQIIVNEILIVCLNSEPYFIYILPLDNKQNIPNICNLAYPQHQTRAIFKMLKMLKKDGANLTC